MAPTEAAAPLGHAVGGYADVPSRPSAQRIVVHDYAGHPFQVQLSRELARRGHEVLHLYSSSTHTPRGRLTRHGDDPPTLTIKAVSLGSMIPKEAFVRRLFMERRYGTLLVEEVRQFRPSVVISGNTPLEAQRQLLRHCRRSNCRLVYWVQDLYGVAAHRVLRRRLPIVGELVGRYYVALERRLIRQSDRVVLISDAFRSALAGNLPDGGRTHVIPNWAPLDELPECSSDNAWAREHGLVGWKVFLYAGTLGPKQNSGLLVSLARRYRKEHEVKVVVISEGSAAEWVRREAAAAELGNVLCLGFQPFERMSEVLATGDVLVALLEPDASVFSVPSKVLTYLCSGRPVLAAVPAENLGARVLVESGGGVVVDGESEEHFLDVADGLLRSDQTRIEMGRLGRAYAVRNFDIRKIADEFEDLLVRG